VPQNRRQLLLGKGDVLEELRDIFKYVGAARYTHMMSHMMQKMLLLMGREQGEDMAYKRGSTRF